MTVGGGLEHRLRRRRPSFARSRATWQASPHATYGAVCLALGGGLRSKGRPVSETGIANVSEICHHLRDEARDGQLEGAPVGIAHVIDLGCACGAHILERAAA